MAVVSVLVVEQQDNRPSWLEAVLANEQYRVTTVHTGEEALRKAQQASPQILVAGFALPDMDGVTLLERMLKLDPTISGVLLGGEGSIDLAVRAMKAGAFDVLATPCVADTVLELLKRAGEAALQKGDTVAGVRSTALRSAPERMVGTSDAMRNVLAFIEKIADSDSTVLIQGESGTGKELAARLLHDNSARSHRPMVPVNCGAIPENLLESELFGHERGAFTGAAQTRVGRFELAHGGTIFLDEIGELSLALQVKLLRVLQERSFERVGGSRTIQVDVRIIAATNQDLERAVRERRFREDLYYRLNVIPITMPALRERTNDIPQLVEHFIARLNRRKHTTIEGCDAESLARLTTYAWPGNIRELENMIERLVVLKKSGWIGLSDLPERLLQRQTESESLTEQFVRFNDQGINLTREIEQFENRLIVEALRQANGITSKAAQLLQLNRTTLVEKLKRKGFSPKAHSLVVNS